MSLKGYRNYFSAKDPKRWVEDTANLWFRKDGSVKTRAMTETMIFDAMKRYKINLLEAAKLLEKSILFYGNHVTGGAPAYWELISRMSEKFGESLDIEIPIDLKPGSSVMYAHLNPANKKYQDFTSSEQEFPTYQKVMVSYNPSGPYWGLWKNGKYIMVFSSKMALNMFSGDGEIDEIEENGKKVPVSVTPIKNMSESDMPDNISSQININRIVSRLEETRSADLRRLLNKSLASGDFDDDPDFKKEVQEWHKKLSTIRRIGRKHGSVLGAGQSDYVSRPVSDGPDSEGTGGNA